MCILLSHCLIKTVPYCEVRCNSGFSGLFFKMGASARCRSLEKCSISISSSYIQPN